MHSERRSFQRPARSLRIVSRTAFSALSACAVGVLFASGTASGAHLTTTSAQPVVLYSLVKAEQFLNTKDDRQRGIGKNPFGNYKDLTPTTRQNHEGGYRVTTSCSSSTSTPVRRSRSVWGRRCSRATTASSWSRCAKRAMS